MGGILGVDIGGVIIDKINDNTDTSFFGSNYLHTTAVPGAFEALKTLSGIYVTHLVSKCGENIQRKTLEWLAHHDFYDKTGVARENVHFCRRRNEKRGICDDIGATHFVDDRLEVLSYLSGKMKLYLFNPNEREMQKFSHALTRVTRADNWQNLSHVLQQDQHVA